MSGCKLRPHHGLCLAFFEGRGYSRGVVAHMAEVVQSLTDDTPVELTLAGDEICRECPRRHGSRCEDDQKVRRYDRAVLAACRLRAGRVLRWGELRELVRRRILLPGGLGRICGDCRWASICRPKAEAIAKESEQP